MSKAKKEGKQKRNRSNLNKKTLMIKATVESIKKIKEDHESRKEL